MIYISHKLLRNMENCTGCKNQVEKGLYCEDCLKIFGVKKYNGNKQKCLQCGTLVQKSWYDINYGKGLVNNYHKRCFIKYKDPNHIHNQ